MPPQPLVQLVAGVFANVESVERSVLYRDAGVEQFAVGSGKKQRSAGTQHPGRLGQERLFMLDMLDGLERDVVVIPTIGNGQAVGDRHSEADIGQDPSPFRESHGLGRAVEAVNLCRAGISPGSLSRNPSRRPRRVPSCQPQTSPPSDSVPDADSAPTAA